MEVNNTDNKDGDATLSLVLQEAPPVTPVPNLISEGSVKKKRRRGKTKRKILKPFSKVPWQERRSNDNTKRNYRFRKTVLTKTQAPFNNNQFLMEIHKPEPENNMHSFRTPSARTRDSSFSVDSEENYFFSLPEDEEEYLTKEFSSVYEDAQSERLSDMSKNDLIQEYLLLEAKYDNLIRRNERIKLKEANEDKEININKRDMSCTDSASTDQDTSGASLMSCSMNDPSLSDIMQRLKEQEEQIHNLKLTNEKLMLENNKLRQRAQRSSEDSESDSSSSSDSYSSSSSSMNSDRLNTVNNITTVNGDLLVNGNHNGTGSPETSPLLNGYHSP